MIPHEHTFVPGLLSFLVAHILYTMSFDTPVRVTWVALPLAGFAAIMLRMLWPGVAGEDAAVRVGVVVYVVAIVIMAYKAVLTRNKALVVGALLFCVSDSVLAWARFIYPYGWCEFTVMLTYYTAQLCIAAPYS
ncbi:hypothetical protein GGF46_001161 [Coemansia sp. RSA 552]|nr:hypothetical protein GGF46_001161 [Coemansia sp. RSA 552]